MRPVIFLVTLVVVLFHVSAAFSQNSTLDNCKRKVIVVPFATGGQNCQDADLIPENIKLGIDILGVTGTYNCAAGLTDCSGTCVDTANNPAYCGDCVTSCNPGEYCSNSICVKQRGEACADNTECITGNCVDGVCCDTTCAGTCESCLATSTGAIDGTCGFITKDTDPAVECGGSACNGAGACLKAQGEVCATGVECDSGFCADGVCCDQLCANQCESCLAAYTLLASDGICGNVSTYEDPRGDCGGSYLCSVSTGFCEYCGDGIKNGDEIGNDCGQQCEQKCYNGDVCATDADCVSWRCNGGICDSCTVGTDCVSGVCLLDNNCSQP